MGSGSRKALARSPGVAAKTDHGIALGPLAQNPKEFIKTTSKVGRGTYLTPFSE